jgi:type IV pilus assembly protein PilY1
MRQGGGCKDPTDTVAPIGVADSCKKDLNGDGVVNNNDCVLAPAADLGYSSYFALDVTNPLSPQVLWEFSDKALGFSTTGPAIVRISAKDAITGKPDKDKNGRWFVVLGSGPTGPIEKDTHQFKGYSDQPLRVFILDLATGDLLHTITSPVIANSFVGHMVGSPIDFDQNNPSSEEFYQDEALYFGYAMAENSPPLPTTKWNRGGVLRLVTKNSLYPDGSGGAPAWTMSKVIEGIGPVTAGVAKLQDYKTDIVRLYFGTGRYYFKVADNIDDAVSGRSLYSVREYCYSSSGFNDACVDDLARTDLGDANGGPSNDADGWYIDLDTCTNDAGAPVLCADATASYMAERNVTDPLATPIGAVFFTTTKPAYDVCTFGGRSHLWAVQFDTGGEVKSGVLRGHALLQVSTGSIEEVDLKTAFHGDPVNNPYSRDNRRTDAYQGVPPTGSPPGILIPPKPQDRILHIRER